MDLAWSTALGTTGPWFSPAVSGQVYSSVLIAATVLVVALAAIASNQAASAAREMRALDLRIAVLKGSGVGPSPAPGGLDIDRDIEDTLDEILGAPEAGGPSGSVAGDRQAHESLVSVAAEGRAVRQEVVLREASRVRAGLHKASNRLWTAVAGPIAGGIAFLAIAGAMLPGVDGFAASNYVLNTTFVLFLGYGFPFLAAWAALALLVARAYQGKKA